MISAARHGRSGFVRTTAANRLEAGPFLCDPPNSYDSQAHCQHAGFVRGNSMPTDTWGVPLWIEMQADDGCRQRQERAATKRLRSCGRNRSSAAGNRASRINQVRPQKELVQGRHAGIGELGAAAATAHASRIGPAAKSGHGPGKPEVPGPERKEQYANPSIYEEKRRVNTGDVVRPDERLLV